LRIWKIKQGRRGDQREMAAGSVSGLDKQGNKQNQACKGEEAEGMLRKNDARVS